jgi:hypothetical protein
MNHQPFEDWLLSDEPLSSDNHQALQEHLETCEECRELQDSWQGVMSLIESTVPMEPAAGFMDRWQQRLEADRQLALLSRQRWQSWIMLILVANVASLFLFILGAGVFSVFESPVEIILAGVYRLTSVVILLNTFQDILGTLMRTLISVVPIGVWAAFAAGLGASCVVWVVSMTSLLKLTRRA